MRGVYLEKMPPMPLPADPAGKRFTSRSAGSISLGTSAATANPNKGKARSRKKRY